MKKLRSNTTYFLAEGKENLHESIRLSFVRAAKAGIRKIVIFTVNGEGIELACREFLKTDAYRDQEVVAVSFPYGTVPSEALEIPEARVQLFQEFRIPLLRATSLIDDTSAPSSSPNHIVRKTLEIFSGGTALCVWAVLVACDAGAVHAGEHVIACCADTAILAKAAPSSHFLKFFAVREIVCKPLIHDLSKGEGLAQEINIEAWAKTRRKRIAEPRQLTAKTEERQDKPKR